MTVMNKGAGAIRTALSNGAGVYSVANLHELNQVTANTVGFAAAFPQRPLPNWDLFCSRDNRGISRFHGSTVDAIHS